MRRSRSEVSNIRSTRVSGFPSARPGLRRLCPVQDEIGTSLCQLAPAINVQRAVIGTLVQGDQGGADDVEIYSLKREREFRRHRAFAKRWLAKAAG